MKRYLACLIALTVALVAIGKTLVQQEGTQESLYQHSQYELSASFGHAIAYA